MRKLSRTQVKAVAMAATLIGLSLAILWADPFAKRYQGKTLNQWLDRSIAEGGIRTDVVAAFGDEVMPELLAAADRWRWLWKVTAKVSNSAGGTINKRFRINERGHKVHDWLAVLHSTGGIVLPTLAEGKNDFMIFHVLKFCDVQELDVHILGTNDALKAQALVVRKMCAERKRLNDISSVTVQP